MPSLALVTALLLRTQSPCAPEVTPAPALELRDPFAAAEREVREPSPEPVRVQLPSELTDPFSRPRAPRPIAGHPSKPSDLVDPFAQRSARAEPVPSRLGDPFSAKPATQPTPAPSLTDPFAR